MVSVTGVLSALKHPDPLRADVQILSVPLTQLFWIKKSKVIHQNNNDEDCTLSSA